MAHLLRLCIPLITLVAGAAAESDRLRIDVTHAVECRRRTLSGDRISVHYNGTLEDGTIFDSSHKRHVPIEFVLGMGQVIAGWDQGLMTMCIGEERLLTIPPSMAYGSRRVGIIPPDSTLIFETQLVAIDGVEEDSTETHDQDDDDETNDEGFYDDEEEDDDDDDEDDEDTSWHDEDDEATDLTIQTAPSIDPAQATGKPAPDDTRPTMTSGVDEAVATQQPISPSPSEPGEGDPTDPQRPGADNGECRLLGPFALFVQAGLGLLAITSLVWKRFRERPRRPFKVWFFDVSKQVFGSALLHVFNLFMSMVATADFELNRHTQTFSTQMQTAANREVNPCSWYLINIAIDTTIGIPILVIWLRILQHAFALTPLARPPESIKSGHYGQPPRTRWWLKQSLIYFVALTLMKLCVYFLILLLPWIALVGDWALRWTEGSEALQVTFVMFVFPLVMNALQYYIIDSFIKDPVGGAESTLTEEDDASGSQPSYHSIDARDSLDSNRDEAPQDQTNKADEQRLLSGSNNSDVTRRQGPATNVKEDMG